MKSKKLTPQQRYEEFMKRPEWPGNIDQRFYEEAIEMLTEVWKAYNQRSEDFYNIFTDSRDKMDRIKSGSPVDITGSEEWGILNGRVFDAISSQTKAIRKSLAAMQLRDIIRAYRHGAPKIDISYRDN